MSAAAAATLLVMFLPFLLSLAAGSTMPMMFCLVSSPLSLLLSVETYGAVMPWMFGMIIAGVALFERLRRCGEV